MSDRDRVTDTQNGGGSNDDSGFKDDPRAPEALAGVRGGGAELQPCGFRLSRGKRPRPSSV
jgi:hypothetical protein